MVETIKIVRVYSVKRSNHDDLEVDLEVTDYEKISAGVTSRIPFRYRAGDPYSPLTPVLTQWLADNNPEILPYIAPPELTPEELRALMPNLSAVEFREVLRSVVLPDYPDGISKAQIQAAINRIPNEKDRDRAQDYWDRATYYQRSNLIIDQLAGLLIPPVTSEQIDQYWPKVIFA